MLRPLDPAMNQVVRRGREAARAEAEFGKAQERRDRRTKDPHLSAFSPVARQRRKFQDRHFVARLKTGSLILNRERE